MSNWLREDVPPGGAQAAIEILIGSKEETSFSLKPDGQLSIFSRKKCSQSRNRYYFTCAKGSSS
jgi:hypothetical protein